MPGTRIRRNLRPLIDKTGQGSPVNGVRIKPVQRMSAEELWIEDFPLKPGVRPPKPLHLSAVPTTLDIRAVEIGSGDLAKRPKAIAAIRDDNVVSFLHPRAECKHLFDIRILA